MMLLLIVALCVTAVYCRIPPSNVCYKDLNIHSACKYGNLSMAVVGKTYLPKDCNSRISIKELEQAPFLYINSTNSTERFTVMMIDLGFQGRDTSYLQWMVTNVSINTLPDYRHLPPNDVVVSYHIPLIMVGMPQPHLVQILVFRHQNVLRAPFGELWVTQRPNFMLSKLFSNISPTLHLCGPVAGIQFWVHDDSPSAPPGPASAPIPPSHHPQGSVPQPGYAPLPGYNQPPGNIPVPGQSGAYPATQDYNMKHFPKKGSAPVVHSVFYLTLVPLAVILILY